MTVQKRPKMLSRGGGFLDAFDPPLVEFRLTDLRWEPARPGHRLFSGVVPAFFSGFRNVTQLRHSAPIKKCREGATEAPSKTSRSTPTFSLVGDYV